MKPVYLMLGLSFIALLMVGCSSSEQPVPSAPTPDLEATVEARDQKQLDSLKPDPLNSQENTGNILGEALGNIVSETTPVPVSTPSE